MTTTFNCLREEEVIGVLGEEVLGEEVGLTTQLNLLGQGDVLHCGSAGQDTGHPWTNPERRDQQEEDR